MNNQEDCSVGIVFCYSSSFLCFLINIFKFGAAASLMVSVTIAFARRCSATCYSSFFYLLSFTFRLFVFFACSEPAESASIFVSIAFTDFLSSSTPSDNGLPIFSIFYVEYKGGGTC